MIKQVLLIFAIASVNLVSSGSGKCKNKEDLKEIVWPQLKGTWYEFASYGEGMTRSFYKCMKLTFSESITNVNATRNYVMKLFGIDGSSNYNLQQIDSSDFLLVGKTWNTPNVQLSLIDTDYVNYAILWSCENHLFGAYHTESSWILTRNRTETINNKINNVINNVLTNHNMQRGWYGPVTQAGCI